MDSYYEKIKKFNSKKNYEDDIKSAKLLLQYCIDNSKKKKVFFIGTGLGGDIKIIKGIKNIEIVGVEPRETFQDSAEKIYKKIGGKLLKMNLGQFLKIKKLSGIFIFIHSINHITKKELKELQKVCIDSYFIIINPNPEIGKVIGKTDDTVISYLEMNDIKKLLKTKMIFDYFYSPIQIKKREIFLREAILLKN
jgi:hypothetical protein